jgi:hypothetical protein
MWSKLLPYAVVMITGGSILLLEVLGSRLIGPYFGMNIYLWTSLLVVTLLSLALGYYLGGFISTKVLSYRVVALFCAVASLWLSGIPVFANRLVDALQPLGAQVGTLLAGLILLSVPITALGCVTPYILKLATESLHNLGSKAADLYAFSTFASVGAALLTAFYFIPYFGVRQIIYFDSAVLGAVSVALVIIGGKEKTPSG